MSKVHSAMFAAALAGGCAARIDPVDGEKVSISEEEIRGGAAVATGVLEAVGRTPGCTATLITQTTALTAGHCVCSGDETTEVGEAPSYTCLTRSSFTFKNVQRVDDPSTIVDESLTRGDVTIPADVVVYPHYTLGHWLANDYALLLLDQRADTRVVGVPPIQVERPQNVPAAQRGALAFRSVLVEDDHEISHHIDSPPSVSGSRDGTVALRRAQRRRTT